MGGGLVTPVIPNPQRHLLELRHDARVVGGGVERRHGGRRGRVVVARLAAVRGRGPLQLVDGRRHHGRLRLEQVVRREAAQGLLHRLLTLLVLQWRGESQTRAAEGDSFRLGMAEWRSQTRYG